MCTLNGRSCVGRNELRDPRVAHQVRPLTPPRVELRGARARSCIVRSLLYAVFARPILTVFLAFTATLCCAQSTWRVDSLLTTWPVRLAVEEARHDPRPGVIRAVDTRDLFAQLRSAAPGLPVFADSSVVRYVDLYGEPRREEFRALLGAAKRHFPMIEGELARQGLDKDLKYLPMAMSAMNELAGSPSGEAGLWMLSYPVALRYGLQISDERDERRDARLATMAATRYLKDLLVQYDEPHLAILAFTCGPANVTRALARTKNSTDLRTLYPHVSDGHRDVLPLLMAFVHLSTQATKLGIVPLDIAPMEAADTLRTERELRMSIVAQTLGHDRSRLQAMNPVLCSDRVSPLESFLLPRGDRARFEQLADSIQKAQELLAAQASAAGSSAPPMDDGREAIHYRVRSGDYLGRIAMRFGVKVSQIKSWNKLRSDRISAGDRLLIYVPASQRERYERHTQGDDGGEGPSNRTPTQTGSATIHASAPVAGFTWYTVQAGDSLYAIAQRYPGVEAKDLMQVNGITADIKPGQKLKIPVQP